MKAPKYIDLLVMATLLIAKTSLVKGDDVEPVSNNTISHIPPPPPVTEPPLPPTPPVTKPPLPPPLPITKAPPTITKATPIFPTLPTLPPLDPIEQCISRRQRLLPFLFDCLQYPKVLPRIRIRRCYRRFARSWRRLSRGRPKKPAICPAEPPADAIIEVVAECREFSLSLDNCTEHAETVIVESTKKENTTEEEEEEVCPEDEKECPFGENVLRDPKNNCEFPECPPEPLFCTQDVKMCPDGSYVGRDSTKGCAFKPCPPTEKTLCKEDAFLCPNGVALVRDPNNNCEFPECPLFVVCTDDIQECPDGSFVNRDPSNDCEFPDCPELIICTDDIQECPDGSFVNRDPSNKCEFPDCPELIICTDDIQECPDGSFVNRDPSNKCEFPPCPEIVCKDDVYWCDDGTQVSRNPDNGCAFDPCPGCCDPFLLTGCQYGDRKCCFDGSWSCPDEEGQYSCDGVETTEPKGKECTCPCNHYTQMVTEDDEISDNSCKDMSMPTLMIKPEKFPSYPLGTFARIDDDDDATGGECAMGDGILRISLGEAKVCVKDIADRCEELGSPIPGRNGPYY